MISANKSKGEFYNSLRYIRVGDGEKVIFLLLGGPGDMFNDARAEHIPDLFTDLINDGYSVYVVSRKRKIPEDYTMYDIAKDIVEVIDSHFGGRIDALIGASFGGFLTYQIAANFQDRVTKYISVGAPYYIPDETVEIDNQMTHYVSKKDYKNAFSNLSEVLYSDSKLIDQFNELLEKDPEYIFQRIFNSDYDEFVQDMIIENKACHGINYKKLLRQIQVNVLLIAGTGDKYFDITLFYETIKLIKKSKLVVLEGKAHGELLNKEAMFEIVQFISEETF